MEIIDGGKGRKMIYCRFVSDASSPPKQQKNESNSNYISSLRTVLQARRTEIYYNILYVDKQCTHK